MTFIGESELDVFPLSLGGNVFGWTSDENESRDVLDAFVAAGGDFIDTADTYSSWIPGNVGGESETIIGQWMADRSNRSSVVIASKVAMHPDFPGLSAENIAAAARASLRRLGTDYIDLYYAHADDPNTPLAETAAAFNELVVAGKVRAIGLSNYSAERINEWMEIADRDGFALPVAVQPLYNLVVREEYENHLVPAIEAHHLGVMPYSGLASGFLTGKYRTTADLAQSPRGGSAEKLLTNGGLDVIAALDDIARAHSVSIATTALAWLRSRPGVVAPIASARTVEQLPDLIASATLELDAEEIARLDEVSLPLSLAK